MAEEEEHQSLSTLFDKYFKIYEDVENSVTPINSDQLQSQVKESIAGLVKATVLVSELSVFSSNESVEELPTSSLKFLLLPVLLGSLTLKRTDIQRSQALRLAQVYFRDFVRRCQEYQITQDQLPVEEEEEEEKEEERKAGRRKAKPSPMKKGMPTPEELQTMARQREEKIKRFRERKAIGERLVELKKSLDNPSHDEDTLRTFHLTTIQKFVCQSLEEVESIMMEEKMLTEMEKMRVDGKLPTPPSVPPAVTPLRPILLTRDKIQKNTFGLGYPSLPSMTVEEFYDQRVREGWFPDPARSQNCLQDRVALDPEDDKEAEEEEEQEEERDDPERLKRDRERDEWRDNHRRGWGNTYNRS
ncbi:hypothetical protein Pmani_000716 [Petrolisthes manimaculis]|uniref:Immunoglobulin-binding protein 1 n=1 Tax=Petrolisthes manimaculis TaxID=1843537 RepID=A0AAE1UM29_9EUCA|nr:hypothetical protein Pmani_000716 [Petrolisthes manimaculis]